MVPSRENMLQNPNIWAMRPGGARSPTTVRLEACVAPIPAPANRPRTRKIRLGSTPVVAARVGRK